MSAANHAAPLAYALVKGNGPMMKLAGRHAHTRGDGKTPATRVHVELDASGHVCLQQLAYSRSAGWYVQKSLRLPPEVLPTLITELRKAQCLAPHPAVHGLLNSATPAHAPPAPTPRPFHPLEKKARANA